MTTVEANAANIFSDARLMRDAALSQMAVGDIRDAAEKAWCATVRATEALVLVRTGQGPGTSTMAGRRLRSLSHKEPSLSDLRRTFFDRQVALHGECFYHDYYVPEEPEEIVGLVNETAEYIREAERLASISL